jgi:hypothetical protein
MTWCILARLFLPVAVAGTVALSGQPLANSSFEIRTAPFGLASLKRVHDRYDTDYIAGGRALGNVLVRFKSPADANWRTALYATGGSRDGQRVSYKVGAAIPTIATSSKASSSAKWAQAEALNDQIEPASSADQAIPRFEWSGHKGTREWVQYDFAGPQSVSSVQVYWFELRQPGQEEERCALPQSWRLLYREDGAWKEVRGASAYGVAPNRYNQVTFDPVTTSALRLEVQLEAGASAGILEWRVNSGEGRQVELPRDLDIAETFTLQDEALEWQISLENKTAQPIEIGDRSRVCRLHPLRRERRRVACQGRHLAAGAHAALDRAGPARRVPLSPSLGPGLRRRAGSAL